MNVKAAAILATALAGLLVGCANHKSSKQAAAEQWGRTRATVLLSLANDQFRAGNLDKCGQTVDQALAMDPTSVELHLLKARLQIEDGQLESALNTLVTAKSIAEMNAEVDYLQGVVHQRWQKPQQALEAYSAAARKNPNDIAYLMAQAEMLVSMDRQPEALELLQARVVYFEHSAAIRDAIAQLYEQAGEPIKAVEYYRQASILDSDDQGIRERLALAHFRGGDYAEAHSQVSRLLRLPEYEKRADVMIIAGECASKLGMFLDARRRFEAAANINANSEDAWLGVARTSIRLNDIRRAEVAANRAVALKPGSAEAQLTQGYVRLRQGRFDDAVASFSRAIASDESDTLGMCMIGLAMQKQGQVREASQWFQSALSANPDDELARRLLAGVTE